MKQKPAIYWVGGLLCPGLPGMQGAPCCPPRPPPVIHPEGGETRVNRQLLVNVRRTGARMGMEGKGTREMNTEEGLAKVSAICSSVSAAKCHEREVADFHSRISSPIACLIRDGVRCPGPKIAIVRCPPPVARRQAWPCSQR
jgi:hypothetical protein